MKLFIRISAVMVGMSTLGLDPIYLTPFVIFTEFSSHST